MNDLDYDAYLKKVTARSAKRKVKTRKGCHLPSDYLTAAQKKKLNGEVYTMRLDVPYSWEEFKRLPKNFQEEYLNHIIDTYEVGQCTISQELFGLSKAALSWQIKRNHLSVKNLDHRTKKVNAERFSHDYKHKKLSAAEPAEGTQDVTRQKEPQNEETKAEETPQIEQVWAKKRAGIIGCYNFTFNDVSDWTDILRLIGNLPLPENAVVKISVASSPF